MVVDLPQRITRLMPLADALACIDKHVAAVAARDIAVTRAAGLTLARDVGTDEARPVKALAVRDGWAVRSELTLDASAYAPALLPAPPPRIDAGELLPDGADAVAPFDAVEMLGGQAQIVAAVSPGEGTLPQGADAAAAQPLRRAGERLRASDVAVLAALAIECVPVRLPRVRIARAGAQGPMMAAAVALVAASVAQGGGVVVAETSLEAALDADGDAVIAIGGTGAGRSDASVQMLARRGQVEFHGVGLMPGETAAFGLLGRRPALLLPGRLDAALAGCLVLGRHLLARLGGGSEREPVAPAPLARKIVSTVGIAEVVPVRHDGAAVEPIATGVLPLRSLSGADGWVFVPADSEGHPAGTIVDVRPLP